MIDNNEVFKDDSDEEADAVETNIEQDVDTNEVLETRISTEFSINLMKQSN